MSDAGWVGAAPLIQAEKPGAELTVRALLLGLFLAVILGAANAYLGLKAGMTVAATFPAAVIAIAAFRLPFMRGGILEQNITRTTATVGEALVAAAIFTLPAFVIAKVDGQPIWAEFHLWQSVLVLGIGGLIGLLFIVIMRRTLTVDAALPFPESHACYEIVRAGQGGETGARFVFGALGLGMVLEFIKNAAGIPLIKATKELLVPLGSGKGFAITTPLASPAIISVGFIIGPRFAALAFTGGVLAWLVIIPIMMLTSSEPGLANMTIAEATHHLWRNDVRTIAVGAMLLASLHTLWGLRRSMASAFRGAFSRSARQRTATSSRLERDLNFKACYLAALLVSLPMAAIYYHYTHQVGTTIFLMLIMMFLGLFLAVIGGWLCGLVGSSNQPVSGLTLTAILIPARTTPVRASPAMSPEATKTPRFWARTLSAAERRATRRSRSHLSIPPTKIAAVVSKER